MARARRVPQPEAVMKPVSCLQHGPENRNDMGKVIHLSKSEFCRRISDVERHPDSWNYLGDRPAVVDFFAQWCGPCRALSPVLDKLAGEYGDRIHIYKVDVDAEPELASIFGVRSVPTLLFAPSDGKPQIARGLLSADKLHDLIDNMLAAAPAGH